MRLILTLLILAGMVSAQDISFRRKRPAAAGGSPAFVSASSANSASGATSITTAGSLTIGTGDLIVVLVGVADTRVPTAIACGSNDLVAHGSTWSYSNYQVQVWYKQGATSGTTSCTATFNHSGAYRVIAAVNYSGAATSGGVLNSSYNTAGASSVNNSTTNRTATDVTTTTADTIHIAIGVDWDGIAGTHTAANSYTKRVDGDTEFVYDKFLTATGTYPNGNFGTTAASDRYMCFYLVFGAAK